MKKNILKFLLITFLLINFLSAESKLDQIKQAIKTQNASWTAGENKISKLSRDEFRQLLGTYTDYRPVDGEERLIDLPMAETIPENFDWRNNNGNWVSSVKDQKTCGSCWDFSAVGQIEAWWKIHYDYPDSNIDLSEQYILSCGKEAGSCEGGWPAMALEFVTNNRLPYEKYMNYKANDNVLCSSIDSGWIASSVTIPGWGYITLEEAQVINIKNALMHHPVSASYDVYEDFRYYNGGVYEHTFGEYEGGHAILIVGWEDENQSWICKNSWGIWGESGYFRIKWGSCNIGKNIPFIYDEIVNDVQLAFSQDTVNVSIPAGRHFTKEINIQNIGMKTVELYASESQDPLLFHKSTNSAYSGMSWWCGVPEIGGYANHWLQYLETPVIDLGSSTNPVLDFMAKWAIEGSAGASSPYDGWDGWNIWISTDYGETYTVLNPTTPQYNNYSLWSFGDSGEGWNMGSGIAGYSGYSSHWDNITCDLSEYIGEFVRLRFAFASDMGYATPEDETLEGLFLDNIEVVDGDNILFADTAGVDSQMRQQGFGDFPNDWLDIYYDNNRIAQNESLNLMLNFTAPPKTGNYAGGINFLANNDNRTLPSIRLNLEVTQNNTDLSIDDIILPSSEGNLNLNHPMGIMVSNNGKTDLNNIPISISADQNNFQEILTIPAIPAGKTDVFWTSDNNVFYEVVSTEISISLNVDDDLLSNNTFTKTIIAGSMLDDFEHYNNNWNMMDWQYTNTNSESGLYCITTTLDSVPSVLTYKNSFKMDDFNLLVLFSAKVTSGNASFTVESSYDAENWENNGTFVVNSTDYTEFESYVVSPYYQDQVWIRFSASSDQNSIIYLDNVQVESLIRGDVDDDEMIAGTFKLDQNYPNPFNPTTQIEYDIPQNCDVKLMIYDISGNLVETLVNKSQRIGSYNVRWNAGNYASGIYFYRLQAGDFISTHKMILMK